MEVLKTTAERKKENILDSGISNLCNIIGASVFLFLMLYFIFMRAIGLHELFALRDFNAVFLFGGILLALSYYRKRIKSKINYAIGFKIGIRVTLMAVIPFAIFIYFYFLTDDGFMNLLKTKLEEGEFTGIFGEYITPGSAAGIICIEGLLSGVIITFIIMQIFRR